MKFIVGIFLPFFLFGTDGGFPSWYYDITITKEKKSAFFKILVPIVKQHQQTIRQDRFFIREFYNNLKAESLFSKDWDEINKLAKKYRIKNIYDEKSFLKRVCAVPTSLVLAQAAIESGWGSSRFVKEANNIFGHWTYGKKGLIPSARSEGKTHKIRIFDTLEDSVAAYMLNLNRHDAYKDFRNLRFISIKSKNHFGGFEAADTMTHYSAIGEEYNKQLKAIIRQNNLLRYDENHKGHYKDFLLSKISAR